MVPRQASLTEKLNVICLPVCCPDNNIDCAGDLVPWCNGSTTDFDSVCLGSNPDGTTQLFKKETFKSLFFILNKKKRQLFIIFV
jgi:hypothetical protein